MQKLRVERIEGALRLVISEDILTGWNASEGDDVVVTRDAAGLHLALADERKRRIAEALEECNQEYGDTLRDLAK